MGTGQINAGGNPVMDWHPIQGGVQKINTPFILASCYRNQDKLRPDGPLGSNADFTYLPLDIGTTVFAQKSPALQINH